jgi:hypothetical protein
MSGAPVTNSLACGKLARRAKYRLTRRANQWFNSARLTATRGAIAIVTTCGGMRWTRRLQLTSAVIAYGEIVWVRRPGAGVKLAEAKAEADDGGKKAGHQDELV